MSHTLEKLIIPSFWTLKYGILLHHQVFYTLYNAYEVDQIFHTQLIVSKKTKQDKTKQ